ncbi:5-carboxymethyl-2-hydroxymuconate Delta-isomerase [Streptomyces sp. NPDC002346]
MPHVTVTYTNSAAFSEEELAPELQSLIVAISGARLEACRTRFVYPQDEWYIAGGTEKTHQAIHIEIALKVGRSAEVKRALSESVLALVRTHLGPTPQFEVHLSVEVRDIDPDGYVSHIEPVRDVPRDAIPQGKTTDA